MTRTNNLKGIIMGMSSVASCDITVKIRTGIKNEKENWFAHTLAPKLREWGASVVSLHGRSKEQRYSKNAHKHHNIDPY